MKPFASNEAIMSKTPERWREEGRKWMRKRYESIERCDTDGFRTQAAYQDFAYMCDLCAQIAENGGYYNLTQLYTLDGDPVSARLVETRYGMAWVIDGDGGTKWFNPSVAQKEATRIRNNTKKGFFVGCAEFPAMVTYSMTATKDRFAENAPRYMDPEEVRSKVAEARA